MKPQYLLQMPLVKLLTYIVAGITITICFNLNNYFPLKILIPLLSALILLTTFAAFKYKTVLCNILIPLLFVILGLTCVCFNNYRINKNHFSNIKTGQNYLYQAEVLSEPVKKNKVFEFMVNISQTYTGRVKHMTNGYCKVLLSSDIKKIPNAGDKIYFTKYPSEFKAPMNPNQFDYGKYLSDKHIYHYLFLNSRDLFEIKSSTNISLTKLSENIRHKLNLSFETKNSNFNSESKIAIALITGEKYGISRDLIQNYSNTGISHLLSISGMHIGIILMFINYILFFLTGSNINRIIKSFITIIIIWMYVFISGNGPAVQRAAIMFSILTFSSLTEKPYSSINALALSFLILVFYDPYLIKDIGFQLSYIAMFAIIIAVPYFSEKLDISNKYLKAGTNLILTTLIAQIFLTPIIIYYFHSLSLSFLLINLIVIPAFTFIIMPLVFIAAILSIVGIDIFYITEFILYPFFKLINTFISLSGGLHFSSISNIYINIYETILLYLSLIFIFIYVTGKKNTFLPMSILCMFVFFTIFIWKDYNNNRKYQMTIYNINKKSAIEFRYGKKVTLFTSNIMSIDSLDYIFNIKNNHITNGITEIRFHKIGEKTNNNMVKSEGNCIKFRNKYIIISEKTVPQSKEMKKIDYLILTSDAISSSEYYIKIFTPEITIYDGSVPAYAVTGSCHYTKKDGAFTINFK